ncbi:MAG TPA: transposase [Firmicutes bacterium]|jgi:transposase|nr:transposase [Bacillota bacterium]
MAKRYSAEFKLEAVRRIKRTGEAVSKVATDLGVNENTMYGWVKRYRDKPVVPFPGSGRLSPEDERLRKLERDFPVFLSLSDDGQLHGEEVHVSQADFHQL